MRIAIIGSKGIPGHHGVEVVVENVTTRLFSLGHEVSVLGYNSYFKGLETYEGCNLIGFDGSEHYSLEMPTHVKNEVKYLLGHSQDYDIVHMHSVDPCLFTLSLKKFFPIVVTSHGRVYKRQEVGIVRKLASRFSEYAFINTGQVKTAVSPIDSAYYKKKYSQDVKYIPNGLETPKNISQEPLSKWNLVPKGYMLFSAGRIIQSKGLHTVLEAYNQLETDIPLVIVGGPGYDGSYYQSMRNLASDSVIFTGFISDDVLWSVYDNAMMAVFPSEYEAQSMTLLEYISLGVPVIYSDIPENTVVTTGIGISFKTGSSSSLTSAIQSFLKNPSEDCINTSFIVDEIRTRHNWAIITDQYLECYTESINEFHRKS